MDGYLLGGFLANGLAPETLAKVKMRIEKCKVSRSKNRSATSPLPRLVAAKQSAIFSTIAGNESGERDRGPIEAAIDVVYRKRRCPSPYPWAEENV